MLSIDTSDIKNKITTNESKLLKANEGYKSNGNHFYFVQDSFKNNDVILPVEMLG